MSVNSLTMTIPHDDFCNLVMRGLGDDLLGYGGRNMEVTQVDEINEEGQSFFVVRLARKGEDDE